MTHHTDHIAIPPIANSPAAKWAYLSLIFTLFYFFALFAGWSYYTVADVTLAICCYVAFIALYLLCTRVSGKQAYYPVAALIGLCAFASSIHPGANTLFGYAAFISGFYFRSRVAWIYLGLNVAAQFAAALTFDLFNLYFLGPSLGLSVGLFMFGMFSHKECVHDIIQSRKNEQIEQLAAIAERERIARDMHDLLGHSLSSLALKSELAQKLIDKQQVDAARIEITQVAELSRQTLSEVRAAVTGLKQKGLLANVNRLCEQLDHLGFHTKTALDLPDLDAKTESTLIMLCKEWITNILRHSSGDRVFISIEKKGQRILLNIEDNGQVKGIKPGNGIDGMKSRIKELSGDLALSTHNGVKLSVTLPHVL